MEKFRILKRNYGYGAIVFVTEYLYDNIIGWYENVCDEMREEVNTFITKREAVEMIDKYKIYLKDSKIVSEEVLDEDGNGIL